MPVRFGSINTGLPPNIVEQLVEAERIPIKQMEGRKGKINERLKLVNDLQTKVQDIKKGISDIAGTRGFSDIKLISGDPNIVTGTVDPATYEPGSWNVEVVQLAEKASVITNGFPDKDRTEIGTGYFRFDTPDGSKNVYVNGQNDTLEGAAHAINAAKVGVRATVINDRREPDAPWKLVLSADGVGTDRSVEYPRLYFLDGDQDIFFEGQREAKNGIVKIDGFEFEIGDNVLKDMIPGVTLELRQSAPGHNVNITVKEDMEAVANKVKTFVESLNAVLTFIQTQSKIDKGTDTSKTLGGDSMIRSVEQRLRNLILSPQMGIPGDVKTLNQIGIQFNRSGTLEFDQKKFNALLARKPDQVHAMFVGDGFSTGFLSGLRREIANLTNPAFGPLTNRTRGLQQQIDQIDQRIQMKERQLTRKEEVLRDKFARLEETMSKIKAQGGQLGALGGGGGGGLTSLIQTG